ncbi:MAG: ABC transporter ATP-binding protein [Myxococcota bacterium]
MVMKPHADAAASPGVTVPHPLARLLHYARRHRRDIRLATLFSVLNKIFDILPEVLIGAAVDVVVRGEESFLAREILAGFGIRDTWPQLLALGAFNVLIWGGESLFEYLYHVWWRNLAQDLQHELRIDVYRHTQQLDLSYFESVRTGNLMSVLNEDINQMERFLNGGINQIIQVLCSSVVIAGIFFVLEPRIAVVALLPVPLILIGAFWFQRKLAPRYTRVREAAADISARLNNNLLGIATIKAFAAEELEVERLRDASERYRSANAAAIRVGSAITPVIRMAILAGFTSTLVYGGWLTLHGGLEVGAYSVLVFLTQRLLWPMTSLADVADMYQRSMSSIDRALDLLTFPVRISVEGTPAGDLKLQGALALEKLQFRYDEARTPALRSIDCDISAGETVAFVGTTGSGKSTLVKLLLRFYEPEHGRILLDGRDISTLHPHELRRAIGYVAQDTFLADGTVAENIAYGAIDVSHDAIVEAARQAECLSFIEELPEGFATHIGERGQKLSGGQRQRLALARAFLKNPKVLILDEATSAVDNETEAAIQRSLAHVARNRTTLLIAHRLSTVRYAHRIHVLERGAIEESGPHEELLARGGTYASLWRLQTGEVT